MAPGFLTVECHSVTSILALKDVIHCVKGAHRGNGLLSTCWWATERGELSHPPNFTSSFGGSRAEPSGPPAVQCVQNLTAGLSAVT